MVVLFCCLRAVGLVFGFGGWFSSVWFKVL